MREASVRDRTDDYVTIIITTPSGLTYEIHGSNVSAAFTANAITSLLPDRALIPPQTVEVDDDEDEGGLIN